LLPPAARPRLREAAGSSATNLLLLLHALRLLPDNLPKNNKPLNVSPTRAIARARAAACALRNRRRWEFSSRADMHSPGVTQRWWELISHCFGSPNDSRP